MKLLEARSQPCQTYKEINDKIIGTLELTDEALNKLHNPEMGNETEIEYRLAWARTYFKKYGLLDNSSRGVWTLTKKADEVHEVNPDEVVLPFGSL